MAASFFFVAVLVMLHSSEEPTTSSDLITEIQSIEVDEITNAEFIRYTNPEYRLDEEYYGVNVNL